MYFSITEAKLLPRFPKRLASIWNFNDKVILLNLKKLIVKWDSKESLEIVNRFISIIATGDNRNDRLQTEWDYRYKLLPTEPVAYDRIDAYLNIL